MTNISVDTAALMAASGRLRPAVRDVQQSARSLTAVLHGLDIEIKTREQIDRRIRDMSVRVRNQAEALSRHQQHLTWAAGRYEGAEDVVGRRVVTSMSVGSNVGGYCPTASDGRGGMKRPGFDVGSITWKPRPAWRLPDCISRASEAV